MHHGSMEKDEVYVPRTRSEYNIPLSSQEGEGIDYDEYLGDAPLYTLFRLIIQQPIAFPAYLSE